MKVNIGTVKGNKKYTHKLPSTVNTTSHFGFCQPICCRELCAQDTISVRTAHQVYLQPVAKPTFGRLSVKQYKSFVPIEDIYHPFASLLSGKSFSGANATYIPTQVPNMFLTQLAYMVYACSDIYGFQLDGINVSGSSLSFSNIYPLDDYSEFSGVFTHDMLNDFFVVEGQCFENLIEFIMSNSLTNFIETDEFTPFESFDWFYFFDDILIAGRFNERGKNLRKILIGLGYQVSPIFKRYSILPIVAYYKAWFDLFAIQRRLTWKDSRAYSFMEYIEQSNIDIAAEFFDSPVKETDFYRWFFYDLPECYYTQNPDFASAHITGTAVSDVPSHREYLQTDDAQEMVIATKDNVPMLTDYPTQQGLDILKALYYRINKATAIGGRIKDFMRSVFGAQYEQEDESNFIGSSSSFIDITQVMNMASTSEGELGEYAGRGVGSSAGDSFKFTAKKQGYYIEFFCLVPDSRLAQMVDPNLAHIGRYDFYDNAFDAKTLFPTAKCSIYGTVDYYAKGFSNDLEFGFGNIPLYTEYKVSFDKINGDMSMLSTRSSFLPFTLQKLLPYTQIVHSSTGSVIIRNVNSDIITNGDIWRYIGLDRWLGNYDRIFVNESPEDVPNTLDNSPERLSGRIDDNFVCFFYVDMTLTGYQIPLADSYQTDSFGAHDTIQKA